MNRLTERDELGFVKIIGTRNYLPDINGELLEADVVGLEKALNRLAAYEDTGLTPEEINAIKQGKTVGKLLISKKTSNAICKKLKGDV